MMRPEQNSYATYFKQYIDLVQEENVDQALQNSYKIGLSFFKSISESKFDYAYDTGKWTIKEVLIHIIDCERIFNYRALSIARSTTIELPGFDHDAYVIAAQASRFSKDDLIQQFQHLRNETFSLFSSFTEDELLKTGTANNHTISNLAIGFIHSGHLLHHKMVIEEKYLKN